MGRKTKEQMGIELGLNRMQGRVYGVIEAAGRKGVMDDDICYRLAVSASTVVPRRGELVAKGLVGCKKEKDTTRHGKLATVWVLSKYASKSKNADQKKRTSKATLVGMIAECYRVIDDLRHEIKLLKDAEAVRQSKHALKGLAALIKKPDPNNIQAP